MWRGEKVVFIWSGNLRNKSVVKEFLGEDFFLNICLIAMHSPTHTPQDRQTHLPHR